MLKETGVEMGLMHDMEQIFFVKNAVRGGLSYVGNRHCVAEELSQECGEPRSLLYADASEFCSLPFGDPFSTQWHSLLPAFTYICCALSVLSLRC